MDAKWKRYTPMLWVLAGFSFAAALAEGYFYYGQYAAHPLLRVLMTVQNALKAFLFSPDLEIKEVAAALDGAAEPELAAGYAYGVAVFTAPLCTATALFLLAERAVCRAFAGLRNWGGTPVLVCGYNADVRAMLEGQERKDPRRYRIHLACAEPLDDKILLWLARHGAVCHQADLLTMPEGRRTALFRRIRLDRVKLVLLMEPSATRNFSLYRALTAPGSPLGEGARCYCLCEDEAARRIIEDACDQSRGSGRAELSLFSLAEMEADSVFASVPLHTVNLEREESRPDRLDVHLLIAGFGAVGQQVLLQAVNLGVLSSSNRVCIDVVDQDMERGWERFTNRFHPSVDAEPDGDEIRLAPPTADGELRIRFHRADVMGRGFARLIERLHGEMPLTYAAVCPGQADAGMHCAVELQKLGGGFPVALRMEQDLEAAEYLEQDRGTFREVFPIPVSSRLLSVDYISDEDRARQAREFNRAYQEVQPVPEGGHGSESGEDGWRELKMYQRRANFLLCRHQVVKRAINPLSPEMRERCFGPEGIILRRGADGYHCGRDGRAMSDAINAVPEIRELAMTEHRRWCCVMAADGWHLAARKNEALRQTPYLTTWEIMCREHPDVAVYDLLTYLTQ